jgi:hypothetical protein
MSGNQTFSAFESNQLNVSHAQALLDKKLISLNIFYDDLAYTIIDQEPKYEIQVFVIILEKFFLKCD